MDNAKWDRHYNWGLRSLELLIAMYLSARDGKRVNLPLAY